MRDETLTAAAFKLLEILSDDNFISTMKCQRDGDTLTAVLKTVDGKTLKCKYTSFYDGEDYE